MYINQNQCPKGVQAQVKESKKENKTEKSFNPIGYTKASFPSTLHLTFSTKTWLKSQISCTGWGVMGFIQDTRILTSESRLKLSWFSDSKFM